MGTYINNLITEATITETQQFPQLQFQTPDDDHIGKTCGEKLLKS
jgi:hypothetical protein